jgi:hypothetical protein
VAAGRDATQVFETYHPLRVHQLLSKYQVGVLSSDELPTFPESSPFFTTLKEVHNVSLTESKCHFQRTI